MSRIRQLTGLYRAIQYSTDIRADVASPERFNATLTDPQNTRLIQNAASTHVLVGLLAFIMLSIVLASLLMNTSRLVPLNPCSIAAITSFLTESNMLQRDFIPESSELLDDKELKNRGIFQGILFSVDIPESLIKPGNNPRKEEASQGNTQPTTRFTIVRRTNDNEARHEFQETAPANPVMVAPDSDNGDGKGAEHSQDRVSASNSSQPAGQTAARVASPSSEPEQHVSTHLDARAHQAPMSNLDQPTPPEHRVSGAHPASEDDDHRSTSRLSADNQEPVPTHHSTSTVTFELGQQTMSAEHLYPAAEGHSPSSEEADSQQPLQTETDETGTGTG